MITAKLLTSLLVAISEYTGYAIPADAPEIVMLPHEELVAEVCGKPCGVLAFTMPNGRILLDDSVAVGRDPVATSILVHELTHFLQIYAAGANGSSVGSNGGAALSLPVDCQTWNAREREAYDVQLHWLRDTAPTMRVLSSELMRLRIRPIFPAC